jgi:hypothetical protein
MTPDVRLPLRLVHWRAKMRRRRRPVIVEGGADTVQQTKTLRVFISSGDDAIAERDFLDALIRDGLTPVLMDLHFTLRFDVDTWERTAPHKILPDASPNDEFVARAKAPGLVIGVLKDKLGQGTREELEAALADDSVEVAIVWCEDRRSSPDSEVSRWLVERQGYVLDDRAGQDNTDGPRIALVRAMTDTMLKAIRQHTPEELLRERRG